PSARMAQTPPTHAECMACKFLLWKDDPHRDKQQFRSMDRLHLPKERPAALQRPDPIGVHVGEPRKVAVDGRRWQSLLYCLPHMIPILVTMIILCINIAQVYWQDLDQPNQNRTLQALQYAAKAHEMMIIASLTAIVVYRIQHDLSCFNGVPLGLLTGGFMFTSPNFTFSREFFAGVTATSNSKGPLRFFPLRLLILLCMALNLVVGPSSAVVMIPRPDWWTVPMDVALGTNYNERVYFNHSKAELWPADITKAIYGDTSQCNPNGTDDYYNNCPVGAMNIVLSWMETHEFQTPSNITISEDSKMARLLTSEDDPSSDSGWTVTSTAGSMFARDFHSYLAWLADDSSILANVKHPLLRPSFLDPELRMRAPLVQIQCRAYLAPDFERDRFEFPHDKLLTPPLDRYRSNEWILPNAFVEDLRANAFDPNTYIQKRYAFDWYDTASNFSSQGAPSLGAVIIHHERDRGRNGLVEVLTTCSIDGRWAPVEYVLDPRDFRTIRQDSPLDILNGTYNTDTNGLIQMRMSLDWAKSMNVPAGAPHSPTMTVVENLLTVWSGPNYTNPDQRSIDSFFSTALGLYLTEGLARAFSDPRKATVLYRQSRDEQGPFVGKLDDPNRQSVCSYNQSQGPWEEWAPQNGYTEIKFTLQRNGYGYRSKGVPFKLASTVLVLYLVLALYHVILMTMGSRVYRGYSSMGELLALAWNSASAKELKNTSAGIDRVRTWRYIVRVGEVAGGRRLQLRLGDDKERTHPQPQPGVEYV
ncbi:MAG: hypothetical protein Q9181_007802, partial [Wetmoreana brouardii]